MELRIIHLAMGEANASGTHNTLGMHRRHSLDRSTAFDHHAFPRAFMGRLSFVSCALYLGDNTHHKRRTDVALHGVEDWAGLGQ